MGSDFEDEDEKGHWGGAPEEDTMPTVEKRCSNCGADWLMSLKCVQCPNCNMSFIQAGVDQAQRMATIVTCQPTKKKVIN